MVWVPGDPWPSGTTGGASAPSWGGYVRLWVRAALAAGHTFTAGPHTYDRLDSGNVLGGAPIMPLERATSTEELWVDLSCDVLDVDVQAGATSSEGVFTKPDAATCVVNLADPTRKYDPLNGDGPYALGGRSRLVPGTPVDVFAEVVEPSGTWSRHWIFSGTADSWGEDWTPRSSSRVAVLVATGESKAFVNMNRPPTEPAVGALDTVAQRVDRIVAESGWAGTVEHGVGTVTLAATTLEGDGWAQLNSALDDEIGFVYFTAAGALRWVGRATWFDTSTPPVLSLGCGADAYDVLVDASPSALDVQLRNSIFASRPSAPVVSALSTSSIGRYGRFDYTRTDLGLATDLQVGSWASAVLQLYAYPQISLADVTLHAALEPNSWALWRALLELQFVSDLVRVYWVPPDLEGVVETEPVDALVRVVGYHHVITRAQWESTLQLVDANALAFSGSIFTAGPHANDRLDAGFVVA